MKVWHLLLVLRMLLTHISYICIICLTDLIRYQNMPFLEQKYPFTTEMICLEMILFAWKQYCLFSQLVGSICFSLNHEDLAVQLSFSSFTESLEVALIQWYDTTLNGSYIFLDESVHAMCSQGAKNTRTFLLLSWNPPAIKPDIWYVSCYQIK